MSLKQYRAFVKICECGSVSKAAQQMKMTQSGVTQLLVGLEKSFGFKLMRRGKNGITLTREGSEIAEYIKSIVVSDDELISKVNELKRYDSGTIRVAAFKSIAVNWMPDIMKKFQKKHPEAKFELVDGCYDDIEQHLQKGDVDAGFVSMPTQVECDCTQLYRDELFAVLPLSHPLAESDCVPACQFGKEAAVSLIDSTDRDARAYLDSQGVEPDIRFKTADDYALLSMVENELGICIAHELVMKNDNHKVVAKKLSPPAFRTIGIAVPNIKNAKPIVVEFIEFLKEWCKN